MSADNPASADRPDVPSPVDLAELTLVEAELDRRWPETRIEPSLARISALMDILGSPQHNYPSIHVAGTNGKTSVARMIDALLTRMQHRTGRTTSPHLQIATERISVDGARSRHAPTSTPTATSSRMSGWSTDSPRLQAARR